MCGICGFIDFKPNRDFEVLTKMVSTLHHRGPDDRGSDVYSFNYASVGLGHTRLSILDLSQAGHQPMNYEHLSIVLNGEIYNFKEIKNELLNLGHKFNSESDTEVILHAFLEWGNSCVSKFIGMYAFVILNKKNFEITIVRDRAGVKPLFYYWNDGLFMFTSELKAFHQHPRFIKKISHNAVHQYMDFGNVPSPYCIFENCRKLNPGHILTFSIEKKKFDISKYWDINDYYRLPRLAISYDDAQNEVEQLLLSAFEYRMVSDVPVGVFLSGGYDSTAVAAMLQSTRTGSKIKTFTIGFPEGNDEAPFARIIAEYIGTDHTEYYCTTREAQDIIPALPFFYDEPFADSSAIPAMLVSKVAKDHVTVALSADAGDELFAGYDYHKALMTNLARINRVPSPVRKSLGLLVKAAAMLASDYNYKNKLDVLARALDANPKQLSQIVHQSYFSLNKNIRKHLFCSQTVNHETVFDNDFTNFKDSLSIALAADYKVYLQNDILTKVDRATMSVGLEGREPFLDHRIAEYVAQLPNHYKYEKIQKRILKDIVHKYVPKKLMDRPKSGFTIPIDSWLKKELSYLLEENLSSEAITGTGLFHPVYVQKLRRDFQEGKLWDTSIIWKLLQFQLWHKTWMQR